jgi:hypothetical protein
MSAAQQGLTPVLHQLLLQGLMLLLLLAATVVARFLCLQVL